MKKIAKPAVGDYAPYFQNYMNQVPEDGNLLKHLKDIQKETEELIHIVLKIGCIVTYGRFRNFFHKQSFLIFF